MAQNVMDPGDKATGEAVKAHRQAMTELNAPPPTAAAPAQTAPSAQPATAKAKARSIPAPGPYGSKPGEKRYSDTELRDMAHPLGAPVYDRGGKVGKVNVHDGKHQLAILKEGERVLTPEQTKVYDKGGKVKPTPFDMITGKDSAKPADLDPKNGTSTSTGGATATGCTGAATGGAVTVTISGSSSTSTSTETSTETGGAGAGAAAGGKGKGKEGAAAGKEPDTGDTGDKRAHVYNITVNSTGQSGNAGEDGEDGDAEKAPVYDNGGKVKGANMAATPFDMITGGGKKAPKTIKHHEYSKTHNGKHVVSHKHHMPEHKDETHMFDKFSDAAAHMDQNQPQPEQAEAGAPPAGAGASPAGAPPAAMPGM